MKTKEELQQEILTEIATIKPHNNSTWTDQISEATNNIAISNLYIALSNLIK